MSTEVPSEGLQLRSTVEAEGTVEVALVRVPVPHPQADEVVVRVEASPINPSDLRVLFAGAEVTRVRAGGTAELPSVRAPLAPGPLRMAAARVGQAMPVGNERPGPSLPPGRPRRRRRCSARRLASSAARCTHSTAA